MPESHLPDNLADWPSDPHALLDVTPGTGLQDIKRAYTRLLKQFKPEQFPEHFRRIREAYETLRRFAEWEERFKSMQTDPPALAEPPIGAAEEPALPMPERSVSDSGLPAPGQSWRLAREGNFERAYQQLLAWQQCCQRDEEAYLRLYWLLWIRPELDPTRQAWQWLLTGLDQIGTVGRLCVLLAMELNDAPNTSFKDEYQGLMARTTNAVLLHDLLEMRWHAAERLRRLDVCLGDLNDCRERLLAGGEVLWVRTLLRLADLLAWETEDSHRQAFQRVVIECRQFGYLAFTLGDEYDRLDYLCEIANQWPRVAGMTFPAILLHLIPRSWIWPDQQLHQELSVFVEEVVREPGGWMRYFDMLYRHAPAVLAAFDRHLNQLEDTLSSEREEPHPTTIVARLLASFLQRQGDADYRRLRIRLLRFCLDESIPPYQLAKVGGPYLVSMPNGENLTLDQAVREDAPLCCVFRLCEVFWLMC